MRNLLGIALAGLLALGVAGSAGAATISYTGLISFGLATLPGASGTGAGVYVAPAFPAHISTIPFTEDQFGSRDVVTQRSELLLVPTHKIAYGPPPVTDTLRNHYKGWRIEPLPAAFAVNVDDQFTHDSLWLWEIEFLANPARKDTSEIRRPNDHLNWYKADGRALDLGVDFVNQFGRDTVFIDSVTHLLVPCRKEPHAAPDALLGHYKAYRIRDAVPIDRIVDIEDQFNLLPEIVDVLTPRYFLTPCTKNAEPIPPRDTHYVVYEIDPKTAVADGIKHLTQRHLAG